MMVEHSAKASQLDSVAILLETNKCLTQRVAQLELEIAKVHHHAYHDSLTGLPNRALLLDRLAQAVPQAIRQHKTVGLLLLDLDRFKSVNDRLGHRAGDLLLQQVATRLLDCIRGCDTACRYGGDEFVVMLPEIDNVHHMEQMDAVTQKIRARFSAPYRLGSQFIAMSASIGAAVLKENETDCAELIRAADAAMYQVKRRITLRRLKTPDVWEASDRSLSSRLHSTSKTAPQGAADPIR